MSIEFSTHPQKTSESILYIERTGTSLHIWVGPLGLHLWRHKGTHKHAPLKFDWDWGYWR
jgi:hypothetical protein